MQRFEFKLQLVVEDLLPESSLRTIPAKAGTTYNGRVSRQDIFQELVDEATACSRCPRMCSRRAVLSDLNGPINARVLFIAEAPGRNGADRTRIPFHGDASGVNFEKLLASIRLTRDQIFITNTVLCSPRSATGANDKPTRIEILNCSDFLRRQIDLIEPAVVATLGAVALDALKAIEPHNITLKQSAGTVLAWNQRLLIPLYHPSPKAIAAVRSLDEQLEDFRSIRRALGARPGTLYRLKPEP
jgi:uracil-DNA glycosylase family 4